MTKLAFVADVHLGNHKRQGGPVQSSLNARCRETLDVLEAAVDVAIDRECDGFVVLGDLFDDDHPLPQLITETLRILQPFPMRLDLLVGNHDQASDDVEDHALAPFCLLSGDNLWVTGDHPRVVSYGRGRSATQMLLVPHHAGPAAEWLPPILDEYCADWAQQTKHRLLGVHLGIQDDDTAHYLKGAHDSIEATELAAMCKKHGITAAFAGNWHDHRKWRLAWPGRHLGSPPNHTLDIVQCGALVPTGWDNPGLDGYGTVVIWHDGKLEYVQLPGPRFVKSTGAQDELDACAAAEEAGCKLYVNTIPDRTASKEAAQEAARAARSADTLDEALGNFVEKMELPEGVEPADVLAKSKGYLA